MTEICKILLRGQRVLRSSWQSHCKRSLRSSDERRYCRGHCQVTKESQNVYVLYRVFVVDACIPLLLSITITNMYSPVPIARLRLWVSKPGIFLWDSDSGVRKLRTPDSIGETPLPTPGQNSRLCGTPTPTPHPRSRLGHTCRELQRAISRLRHVINNSLNRS